MNPAVAEGYMASPATPERPFPPVGRPHAVSEVTPAKKITFFKSGDPQFGGVKMAISRRSFKSFSALMDDLSNRVPLPFGVRTITTPRGTHSINRLDQLQDGGSYICSDKKYVQPITGRKIGLQRVSRPLSARKQGQQEDLEEEHSTHLQQVPKLRKKITLVKNGDPTIRRAMILNRRNARNFRTFLEDASDVLQYTVRRIYTVDGRRIENIQAILQSPTIFICVGREPFKPIQAETVPRSITEKLPGLRTHHSNAMEILDNKRNVNFGLKAKKSVIHPRSASSTKTRFSLSSEKSFSNGLNVSPVNSGFASYPNSCPKSEEVGHSLVNDDIEKRVHVNKDGSLSVEMKVRFRLLNEETLQWSTQIKKSSTFGKAKCEQLFLCNENDKKEEINPENFSESDESFYPCDADSYGSKFNDAEIDNMYCSHCGMHSQDYDIWKNPMHANQPEDYIKRAEWQSLSSASSTSTHHKLVCEQKASLDSFHTTSSEECTEHVMTKSSCYSETRENEETVVRYSSVSRCTSRSGQSTAASNMDEPSHCRQRRIVDSQHKSSSSLKKQISLQNQLSEGNDNSKHYDGSFEKCNDPSPTPCSEGENCSRRASVVSQTSVASRQNKPRMFKRNSGNTKSFGSDISCKEEKEEKTASPKEMLGACIETEVSDGNNECIEQYLVKSPTDLQSLSDQDRDKNRYLDSPSKSTHGHSDKGSVRSSSCSKSSAKESHKNHSHQSDGHSFRSSPCSSSVSKQDSEIVQDDHESLQAEKKCPSCDTNRKSYAESQQHSFKSNRSHQSGVSVSESALSHAQEEEDTQEHQKSCDESRETQPTDKSEECTTTIAIEDEHGSLHSSGQSNKSQSVSSKHNCVRGQENEQVFSFSSRVSSFSEKKSKRVGSSDVCDQNSSKDSSRQVSQDEEKPSIKNEDADTCCKEMASENNSVHVPSPPKGKPVNRHIRSSQFKLSNTSMSSDPIKAMNGNKTESSRSSTPRSKAIGESTANNDMCEKTVNSMTSMEDTQITKKRKNSSSSSKRKPKGESVDVDNNSELTPSALPNITPEEVVNEWLRNIPSQTMTVDYEVEECQNKTKIEHDIKTQTDKGEGDGKTRKDSMAEVQDNSHVVEELQPDVACIVSANNLPDANNENDDFVLSKISTNNVKSAAVTLASTCNKNSLPNNIHTCVQIMKALLNPAQDTKYDRSNSLPEVSQTMGRKLSNSAKVLISCLASLQLLDEGHIAPTKNANDLNKPKYIELLDIFQALWDVDPTNRNITNIKTGRHYSREDELTPVSSSGVDINSGFEGSGDGSVNGAGDSMITADKSEKSKLYTVAKEENSYKNVYEKEQVISCAQTNNNEQITPTAIVKDCPDELQSCVMDENMNEKKIDNSDNTAEGTIVDHVANHTNSNDENHQKEELTETPEENGICSNDAMNILSQSGNEPKSNDCNSQETTHNNSPSDGQSTVISTSESNGKNEDIIDKQSYSADPVWVLKLLKKIETEFMTHYVDAMNEFKIRWNLENNENLDEMIAELKEEVSQRIQRSISNELKKIKSRAGNQVPRPPNESSRRKSSVQADERRRRLQSMHKKSIHNLASGENSQGGTNDLSFETDEEDLTFSASFADDGNGQSNDEFCPCEKCLKQKRALKLAKPKAPVADAPIMAAFDLQQILKMKRGNNDPKNNGPAIPPQEECGKNVEAISENDNVVEIEGDTSKADCPCSPNASDEMIESRSNISDEENEPDVDGNGSVVVEDEACEPTDCTDHKTIYKIGETEPEETEPLENEDADVEDKFMKSFEEEMEMENAKDLKDNNFIGEQIEETNMNGPLDENTSECKEEEPTELGHNSEEDVEDVIQQHPPDDQETKEHVEDIIQQHQPEDQETKEHVEDIIQQYSPDDQETKEHVEDIIQQHPPDDQETKDNSEPDDESSMTEAANNEAGEISEEEDYNGENKTTDPAINADEDVPEETEASEMSSLCYLKSCLGQGSIVTHNGSVEESEKELNNNPGDSPPNGESDSSGSKQSQMYPKSSSEDEDEDSPCTSPVGMERSDTIRHVNNQGGLEDCDNQSKKDLDEDIIDQDDLDF